MDSLTITVLYSCNQCGLKDAECLVPARTTEDVVLWVKQIMGHAVSRDHDRRSPHCKITSLTEVKVPVTGASKIGGVSEN